MCALFGFIQNRLSSVFDWAQGRAIVPAHLPRELQMGWRDPTGASDSRPTVFRVSGRRPAKSGAVPFCTHTRPRLVVCAKSCRAVSPCSARDVHTIGPQKGSPQSWSTRLPLNATAVMAHPHRSHLPRRALT